MEEIVSCWTRPGETSVDADHATYRIGRCWRWFDVDDILPESLVERRDCRRPWDQVVWADGAELVIVIYRTELLTLYFTDGGSKVIELPRVTLEVWGAESRFHDRLDELAGVEVRHQELEVAAA